MGQLEWFDDEWLHECRGRSEDEVRKAIEDRGGVYRVVRQNGFNLLVTRDYVPERVNVHVRDGVVVHAYCD